jgi:hypothetical protein
MSTVKMFKLIAIYCTFVSIPTEYEEKRLCCGAIVMV